MRHAHGRQPAGDGFDVAFGKLVELERFVPNSVDVTHASTSPQKLPRAGDGCIEKRVELGPLLGRVVIRGYIRSGEDCGNESLGVPVPHLKLGKITSGGMGPWGDVPIRLVVAGIARGQPPRRWSCHLRA